MLLLPILIPLVGGLTLLFWAPPKLKAYCYSIFALTALSALALPTLGKSAERYGYFPLGVELSFFIDPFSILFSLLFVLVWGAVLRYAFCYLHGDPHERRFLAFFLATLGAMIGVSYANNLVTLYLCFELISLNCFSLVAHEQTETSMAACKKYLFYSIGGAFLGLIAIMYFYSLGLPMNFAYGGIEGLATAGNRNEILGFLTLAIIGFGCKAGLFPLHGWLKTAHPIAPAPASAVLSGITTKAGVIAIFRLIYCVVGADFFRGTAVQTGLIIVSLVTIFLGSMLAYREKVLKARLAYSTVSQVAYIIFGLLICHPVALVGAMLHAIAHALAKNSLFLCAGTIIHETGVTTVDGLRGLGRPLRRTFVLFAIAALSLVGIPFTGGFISKWSLAVGGLAGSPLGLLGVAVIMLSALLTAGYLLPIVVDGLFAPEEASPATTLDTPRGMTSPTLAVLTILLGICPLPVIDVLERMAGLVL